MRDIRPGTREKIYGKEYVTEEFSVTGRVERETRFGLSDVRSMDLKSRSDFTLLCGSGKVKDTPRAVRGALLRDFLDRAGVVIDDHEAPNRTYVVATGSDGYRSMFTWHELYNTAVGDGVIVVIEKDGEPLGEREGRFCLVSANDERPGPRRVRYLKTVEVRSL